MSVEKPSNQQLANRKIVHTFAWASFLNDIGSDIIYPIWPLFVTEILKANMAALGFIDGLGEAIVSIAKAISGFWSDRIRRRKQFIWTGYLMASLSRFGYAISTIWQHLIPFRILDRAGKIRGAPRDAGRPTDGKMVPGAPAPACRQRARRRVGRGRTGPGRAALVSGGSAPADGRNAA